MEGTTSSLSDLERMLVGGTLVFTVMMEIDRIVCYGEKGYK